MTRIRADKRWSQSDVASKGAASVLITDTQVIAAHQGRIEVTLCNDHATQVVYLALGGSAAVANQGIRLNAAGGSYTTNAFTGEIRGISVGGTSVVTTSQITTA